MVKKMLDYIGFFHLFLTATKLLRLANDSAWKISTKFIVQMNKK